MGVVKVPGGILVGLGVEEPRPVPAPEKPDPEKKSPAKKSK